MKPHRLAAAVVGAAIVFTASLTANASHSWNNYHWARTTSSLNLQVLDSNTSNWDDELSLALSQWSRSSKLNMARVSSSATASSRRQCASSRGKVRSCNYTYGNTGWLGLASINIDSSGHIVQGTSKVNDSYASSFASQNQRRHVMCQELGHTIGLSHTSEDGSSQSTCMDYSQSPNSTAPNAHDYNQLLSLYGHTDGYNSTTAVSSSSQVYSEGQDIRAGRNAIAMQVRKGVFDEMWVQSDGKGGIWVHHITLAPGFEHTELIGK